MDFAFQTRLIQEQKNGKYFPAITCGAGSYIAEASYEVISYRNHVLIGKFCSLGHGIVFNVGMNHNYKHVTTYPFDNHNFEELDFYTEGLEFPIYKKPDPQHHQIIIGNDVWIGRGVMILGGAKIGNGAVIGANAVVAGEIPPYAIAVGNPARVLKYRFDSETIYKLQKIRWWNWDIDKIRQNIPIMENVEEFVQKHYSEELNSLTDIHTEFDKIESEIVKYEKCYQFVADFHANYPLWQRILMGFGLSNFQNSLLVIWFNEDSTADDIILFEEILNLLGNNVKPHILKIPPKGWQFFLPQILKKATHFITTREIINIEFLDLLYNTDIKIVSALDDSIFENEPKVMWKKIYE